jgi:hypothetical protein
MRTHPHAHARTHARRIRMSRLSCALHTVDGNDGRCTNSDRAATVSRAYAPKSTPPRICATSTITAQRGLL